MVERDQLTFMVATAALVIVAIPFFLGEDYSWQISQGLDVADKAYKIFQVDPTDTGQNITAVIPDDKAYLLAGENITIDSFFANDTIRISGAASIGEANTGANVGSGLGVFRDKTGVTLNFDSIIGGTGIDATDTTDDITLSIDSTVLTTSSNFADLSDVSPGCADGQIRSFQSSNSTWICDNNVGETNTASNVGSGVGVFDQKSGVDLEFNSLIGGDGIDVADTVQDITIDVDTTVIRDTDDVNALNNVNHGACGNGQQLTWNTGTSTWICGNDETGVDENTSAINVGAGLGVFDLESGDELQFNSLIGGTGISIADTTQDLTITLNAASTDLTDTADIVLETQVNSYGDGFRQTFNPDATNAGINVGGHTAEPSSPTDGDIFLDTTANELKARVNGAWVNLGASGGVNNLLDGSAHQDTVAQTVTRGSLIYGDATPNWNELTVGGANTLLRSDGTDPSWGTATIGSHVTGASTALTDTDDIAYLNQANLFGDFDNTFKDNRVRIENPAGTFEVGLQTSAELADRVLTIPLLGGNRDIVVTGLSSQITLGTEVTGASTALTDTSNIAYLDTENSWSDGITQTFNPSGTEAGINVGAHTAEPSSPADGDIFYDSTANQLKGRVNSAWVDLGASGGSGHTIEEEGTPLTARTGLNFVGGIVTATDDAGNDETDVTLSGTMAEFDTANEDGNFVYESDNITALTGTTKANFDSEVTDGTHIWANQANTYSGGGAQDFAGANLDNVASLISNAGTPAGAGAIRLGNAELIAWEASPASTDITITVDSAEDVTFSTSANNIDFNSNPLINTVLDADGTGNSITNIEDADIKAGAAIATTKLADSANFVLKDTAQTYDDGIKLTFNPSATNAGVNVGAHTAEPSSPVDGDIFYDSTANQLKGRANSAWVDLGAGAGGIQDIIQEGDSNVEVIDAGTGQVDIDVDATNIVSVDSTGIKINESDRLTFDKDEDSDTYLTSDVTDQIRTFIGGAVKFSFRASGIDMVGNDIINIADLQLDEQASTPTPAAGHGKYWVRNDAPNEAIFTDDTGGIYRLNGHTSISFLIDGGGSAITTGIKGDLEVPFDCDIQAVTMLADQSGSIVVDIWKDTYANYPPTDADSITASAVPTISSAVKSQDTTLTGWTTQITKGDTIRYNVDSITSIERVTLSLECIKN